MAFERLPFRGTLSFAARLSGCTGCIAEFAGAFYECVTVDWTQDPHGADVIGHVLFTPVAEQGGHRIFPEDLVKELLASSP